MTRPARSASGTIVRNFQISNGAPSLPERICLKMTGPFEVRRIANAVNSSSGLKTMSSAALNTKSKMRFVISSAMRGDDSGDRIHDVVQFRIGHRGEDRERDE